VTRSSGYARLDDATCDLIVLHASFPPAKSNGVLVATTRLGKINWTLPPGHRGSAARAPRAASFTKTDLESKRLFCKRTPITGSMLKHKTHCLTRAEWGVADAMTREQVLKFINPYSAPVQEG
jgi:hypothetical protein